MARCIECMAFIARANGAPRHAARLLGTAEALRENSASPMTGDERVEYDREISALRAAMDERDFHAMWQEGRVLSTDQAIAVAVEEQYPE